jgi:hypothetical protein
VASTTVFPRARRAVAAPLLKRARAVAAALARPAKPVLASAAQIPLTVTAYGLLATAATLWDTLVGLASTAVLLIVLEHQLADES